ncbi:hypothetical protein [Vibrio diabolicus]|uniref:hypothetical protein n=1 Tax=Vibrio diabolicus TaxID=50719 RepID=UPI00375361EE
MKPGEFKMWQLLEKPTIKEQFKRWLKLQEQESFIWKDCDFESKGIQLLFRNYTNDITEPCMTIASIYLSEYLQNQGYLSHYLTICQRNPLGTSSHLKM